MKLLIVDRHTTPETPAMHEVPTMEVPVYDTLADAEADLANLEDGQIITTKDTGDELAQPVDVVEDENLHAVTSNAVYKKTKIDFDTTASNLNNATSENPWVAPHNGIVFVRVTVTATSTSSNKVYYIKDKTLNLEYGDYNTQPAQTFSFSFPIFKGNEYYRGGFQNVNNVQIITLYLGD